MREGVIVLVVPGGASPLPLWGRVAPHEVRRRVRGMLPQGELCKDVLQYRSGLLQHVIVPVARDDKAFSGECCVTSCVASRFRMLTAVDFDHEALFQADEIENVGVERDLSAKL